MQRYKSILLIVNIYDIDNLFKGKIAFPGTKDCWESIHRELEKLNRKDMELLDGSAEQLVYIHV